MTPPPDLSRRQVLAGAAGAAGALALGGTADAAPAPA
ncbi:MAG: twin-arginine translocation signal domain-containing protein, partial [Nocardioidaceae bacterium]|nr:twin-arginine translocation signal domain-containing protein [Nocardioidaceae bacterium]